MPTNLDRARWERIATAFERAIETGVPEREALLDRLCGADVLVRREVEAMLAAHFDERGGLLAERGLAADDRQASALPGRLPAGTRVGPYVVASLLGTGGMSDVYRAERSDGAYRQAVALKVLRPGPHAAELGRRFRVEREALARLAHPGIATILDGGALEDGRPYLVLQLVEGEPITRYCEAHALSLRDRLALFARVAEAVQFAHGRLVVHRDIKPSNILVQPDGTPRLLDFGIAKLLDVGADASLAVQTSPEVRLLTPEYAAPEQLRGEPPSTATDVWALGVLLFELLTGARPFPAGARSALALERAILEMPAPAPSTVATSRASARRLRGDLDRIVLMALRKEPERRYQSAAQLAEDVQRWLAGRPVRARPDSWRYRASRFIARNRALVAGGAALAIALAGFAVTAGVQARRIARERDRAERERLAAEDVLAILTGLFERADPNKYPGGDTLRVTSLLDDAERKVGELAKEPDRQAALWRAVGRMRAARGEYARALDLLGRARARRISTHGATDIEAARIRHESAKVLLWYRGEAAARPLLDSSLAELRALLGEEHEEVRAATADLVVATADSNVARALLDRLLALERRAPSRDPVAIASRLNDRGSERFAAGHAGDATTLFEASLALLRDTLPPEDAAVRTVQRNLALALVRSGALARAESLQRASLALEDRLRSAADTRGMAHEALALTLVARGRADSAEAYERTALRLFREAMAPDHWRIWSALRNVAFIAGARGHDDEALALLDSAIALASRNAEGGESAAYLRAQRVPFLLRLGRIGEATRTLADAERGLGASPSVTVPHRADVHRYAAMIALASGDAAAAVRRLRAAVALAEPPGDAQRPASINTCLLGVALARADSIASARAMLDAPCASYLSRGLPDRSIAAWIGEARARTGDRVSR